MHEILLQTSGYLDGLFNSLIKLDVIILDWIQNVFKNNAFDILFPLITYLGDFGIIWIIISIILIVNKKYRKYGILLAVTLVVTVVVNDMVIKPLIARDRPFITHTYNDLLIRKPHSFSFPSGHTAIAFGAAFIINKTQKIWGIYAYILAILIAFSRMYLLVHYPSDVMMGVIVGTLTALLTYSAFLIIKKFTMKEELS